MEEPGHVPDPQAVLEHLLRRYSIGPRQLAAPGPAPGELRLAACAAMRAPDHKRLSPVRLIEIPDARRAELAALFEDFARRAGRSEAEVREEAARAWNGPALVALAACVDTEAGVPAHEQWIAVGGALANFMNALHLMGYGAKMLSGRKAADQSITAALCEPGETLVGWIAIGTPTAAARARGDDDPDRILRVWKRSRPTARAR